MKKFDMKLKLIVAAIVMVLFAVSGGVLAGFKLISHEKAQKAAINHLFAMVEELQERQKRTTDYYLYDIKWGKKDEYNYLALGNSLTLIESWGRGICSTQPDNDYFGLVLDYLEDKNEERHVVAHRYNYAVWEKAADRGNVLDLVDVYLDSSLDLVTIQLGENATDISTYKDDMVELVNYIRAKAPNAQIIIIDDFWSNEKSEIRKAAAEKSECAFADLGDIRGKKEYQSENGIVCYLEDGNTITVQENAATHPGDEGMEFIADRVIEQLQ